MENYIVRIYRHEKGSARKIVGTVEEAGQEGKSAFTNYDELWDILNPPVAAEKIATARSGPAGKRRKERAQ